MLACITVHVAPGKTLRPPSTRQRDNDVLHTHPTSRRRLTVVFKLNFFPFQLYLKLLASPCYQDILLTFHCLGASFCAHPKPSSELSTGLLEHTRYPLGSVLYLLILIRTTSFADLLCPLACGAVWGLARAGKCLEYHCRDGVRGTPALGHTVSAAHSWDSVPGRCATRSGPASCMPKRPRPPAGPRPRAPGGGAPGRPQQAGGGGGSASASRQRLERAGSTEPGSARRAATTPATVRRPRVDSGDGGDGGASASPVARLGPAAGSGSAESGPRVEWPTQAVERVVGPVPRQSGLRRCHKHWESESVQGPL